MGRVVSESVLGLMRWMMRVATRTSCCRTGSTLQRDRAQQVSSGVHLPARRAARLYVGDRTERLYSLGTGFPAPAFVFGPGRGSGGDRLGRAGQAEAFGDRLVGDAAAVDVQPRPQMRILC